MKRERESRGGFVMALVLCLALGLSAAPAHARDVVVFAAASLKNALDEAASAWERETGKKAVISYAGSNALVRQIEAGAPADILFSADLDWMDHAAARNLIIPESRIDLLRNTLVLIAPRDSETRAALQPGLDLASVLGNGRLAMANVNAVPAGKYGKAALDKLGAWEGVRTKVAQADNVRAALLLVSRGEAPLGIVYRTDASADPDVRVVATFPEDSHPAIVYPAALVSAQSNVKNSRKSDAASFLAFLRTDRAKTYFEKHGFMPISGQGSPS